VKVTVAPRAFKQRRSSKIRQCGSAKSFWIPATTLKTSLSSRSQPAQLSRIGGQLQNTWRSPWTLSMRATLGQNLCWRSHGAGQAAWERGYGRSHSSLVTHAAVCGAFLSGLFARSSLPDSMETSSAWIVSKYYMGVINSSFELPFNT